MAVTKFLARDLLIQILGTTSGADWEEIKGLETLSHAPTSTLADTTDFDSVGRREVLMAERGDDWTLSGYRLEDVSTGARDPGQAEVEALAQRISTGSVGSFRITTPGGNLLSFSAIAEVTLPGGSHNAPAAWGAKLTVTGAIAFS